MDFCSGFRAKYREFPFAGWNNVATLCTRLCFYVSKNTILTAHCESYKLKMNLKR